MIHILLVDDDPELLWMIREVLTIEGYRVTTALSRLQAGEAIRRGHIDIVVTDDALRGGNGNDVAKAAQQNQIPVIVMSAEAGRVKRPDIGDLPFLGKPFAPAQLLEMITTLLPRTSRG